MPEDVKLKMDVDTSGLDKVFDELQKKSDLFGRTLTGALKGAAVSGQDLGDVLKQLALSLSGAALSEGLKPLQGLASGMVSDLLGGLKGAAKPHAKGGIVDSPTYFNAGGSLGLMGEAGSEAIMPLTRGADGRLGVAAQGGGSPVHVTFNVTTPDAHSFRKSEAQLTGMLAKAARRGARSL